MNFLEKTAEKKMIPDILKYIKQIKIFIYQFIYIKTRAE